MCVYMYMYDGGTRWKEERREVLKDNRKGGAMIQINASTIGRNSIVNR